MDVTLSINGFESDVHFDDGSVRDILLPLLENLTQRQRCLGRRLIAFLAAPPGTGKSTLAALLDRLSRQDDRLVPVQALGMDGFHFHQDYILSHTAVRGGREIPMREIKGSPETFDVKKLRSALLAAGQTDILWPFYDRRLHDVVEDAIEVTAPVLLVEGNWLLLRAPEWASLPRDFSVFIDAEEALLRRRLIDRKVRGGLSREEAERYCERSDGPNIAFCRAQSLPADLRLNLVSDGLFRIIF